MASFDYASHVVAPGDVTKMSNIFSVVFNVRDALDYGKSSLLNGYDCKGKSLILGNKFFVENGFCDEEQSVSECKKQRRYMYIDNLPGGVNPCIDPSQPVSSRCSTNQNYGLIPGVIQDIIQVSPSELMYSSVGKGSVVNNRCVLRTEDVGYQTGSHKNFVKQTKCAPEKQPLICGIKESFSTSLHGSEERKRIISSLVIVVLGLFFIFFFGDKIMYYLYYFI